MQPFVLRDERADAFGPAIVMRMERRGWCDLCSAVAPVHSLPVDDRIHAFALQRQRHRDAVVAVRALIAAARECVDPDVDRPDGHVGWGYGARVQIDRLSSVAKWPFSVSRSGDN